MISLAKSPHSIFRGASKKARHAEHVCADQAPFFEAEVRLEVRDGVITEMTGGREADMIRASIEHELDTFGVRLTARVLASALAGPVLARL
jgi:hypothetical protein